MNERLQDTDIELFRSAVAGTEPLTQSHQEPWRRRPPPFPIFHPYAPLDEGAFSISSEEQVETQEYLLYAKPGVQRRVLANLQGGGIRRELKLDLHGLTTNYAARLCHQFLVHCTRYRVRCVQIIHGKGYGSKGRQPILKQKINYWLRLHPDVLAFCSATQQDGGTGAIYVLIKNPDKTYR